MIEKSLQWMDILSFRRLENFAINPYARNKNQDTKASRIDTNIHKKEAFTQPYSPRKICQLSSSGISKIEP
jgi:hypothetical protein